VNGAFSDADKPLPQRDALIGAHIGAARNRVQVIQYSKGNVVISGGPGEIRTHDLCLRRAAYFAAGDWVASLVAGQGDRFAALPTQNPRRRQRRRVRRKDDRRVDQQGNSR
jgi:hypothetical protein